MEEYHMVLHNTYMSWYQISTILTFLWNPKLSNVKTAIKIVNNMNGFMLNFVGIRIGVIILGQAWKMFKV